MIDVSGGLRDYTKTRLGAAVDGGRVSLCPVCHKRGLLTLHGDTAQRARWIHKVTRPESGAAEQCESDIEHGLMTLASAALLVGLRPASLGYHAGRDLEVVRVGGGSDRFVTPDALRKFIAKSRQGWTPGRSRGPRPAPKKGGKAKRPKSKRAA